ncbi:MAG: hypothetical protein ABW175_25000 [Bradyrhizobium sp.]
MTNDDRGHDEKATKAAENARSALAERDAANRAALDNMARLKALRLAREAAEPQRAPAARKTARAKSAKPAAKATPALSDWLASQQNGGRRI